MTKQAWQVWQLVGLLGVLGGVLTYELWPAQPASSATASSNQKNVAGVPSTPQVATVNMDRLQATPPPTAAEKRDPFRFKPKPPPPPPPPVQNQRPQLPINIGPPPPPPDPRPEISMKYLGYAMSPNGARVAVLQETNRPPLTGKQGDVIDGKYRLLRVDANEVELSYLDGARRKRIVKGQ